MENPTDFTSIATTIIEEESNSVLDWLIPGSLFIPLLNHLIE
mgnify:CR=1 FL=1